MAPEVPLCMSMIQRCKAYSGRMSGGKTRVILCGLGSVGLDYDLVPGGEAWDPLITTSMTHSRSLATSPRVTFLGGVDPDPRRRQMFSETYGLPASPSVDSFPAESIDMAVVAVPTQVHMDTIEDILGKWRPKLIVCEKPGGASHRELEKIVETCSHHGVLLVINYQRQYLPSTWSLREFATSRDRGDFQGAVVTYSLGLRRNGTHFIRLLNSWFGSPLCSAIIEPNQGAFHITPSFRLDYEAGPAYFIGCRSETIRIAEVQVQFTEGVLRYEGGGKYVWWNPTLKTSEPRSLSYSKVPIPVSDPTLQGGFLDSLVDPGFSADDWDRDVIAALEVQAIVDDLLSQPNHLE